MRDLGGLPTADGGRTRWGAVVRGGAPDGLTPAGWDALRRHGIRTIVDLRNDDERATRPAPGPEGLTRVDLPLDGIEHTDFWEHWANGPQFGTPLYYGPFLERFPDRTASVISAIGRAAPGGVLVHCELGRDRAGLISMLLLGLAGVGPEHVAGDYELSATSLAQPPGARGTAHEAKLLEEFFATEGTTARELVIATLSSLDVEAHLRRGGLSTGDLAAVKARLVDSA